MITKGAGGARDRCGGHAAVARIARRRAGMRGGRGDVAGGVAHVVIAAGYGGPEVLSVAEEPLAGPGPGEARIEVRAAGVNPVDAKSYSGAFGKDPARLPIRLGAEAPGVVTALGPDPAGRAGPLQPAYCVSHP